MQVTYTLRKSNDAAEQEQAALRWRFDPPWEGGAVRAEATDPDLALAPLTTQIEASLKRGPKSVQLIATELGKTVPVVRTICNRMLSRGLLITVPAIAKGGRETTLFARADTEHNRQNGASSPYRDD